MEDKFASGMVGDGDNREDRFAGEVLFLGNPQGCRKLCLGLADAEERDGGDDLGDLLNHVFAIDSRVPWWSQSKCGRGLAR